MHDYFKRKGNVIYIALYWNTLVLNMRKETKRVTSRTGQVFDVVGQQLSSVKDHPKKKRFNSFVFNVQSSQLINKRILQTIVCIKLSAAVLNLSICFSPYQSITIHQWVQKVHSKCFLFIIDCWHFTFIASFKQKTWHCETFAHFCKACVSSMDNL